MNLYFFCAYIWVSHFMMEASLFGISSIRLCCSGPLNLLSHELNCITIPLSNELGVSLPSKLITIFDKSLLITRLTVWIVGYYQSTFSLKFVARSLSTGFMMLGLSSHKHGRGLSTRSYFIDYWCQIKGVWGWAQLAFSSQLTWEVKKKKYKFSIKR